MRLFRNFLYYASTFIVLISVPVFATEHTRLIPRGLLSVSNNKDLMCSFTRIDAFIKDSAAVIDSRYPTAPRLFDPSLVEPTFNASLINKELLDSLRYAEKELLTLVDPATAKIGLIREQISLINEGNKRWFPEAFRNILDSSLTESQNFPSFNNLRMPKDRSDMFTKENKPLKQTFSGPVTKLNIESDKIEFLDRELGRIRVAKRNALLLLEGILQGRAATFNHFKLAEDLGTPKPVLAIWWDRSNRAKLRLPPRDFAIEDVRALFMNVNPTEQSAISLQFSQAGDPSVTDSTPLRRTLGRRFNNPFLAIDTRDPSTNPFTRPFDQGRFGTRFATGIIPSEEGRSAESIMRAAERKATAKARAERVARYDLETKQFLHRRVMDAAAQRNFNLDMIITTEEFPDKVIKLAEEAKKVPNTITQQSFKVAGKAIVVLGVYSAVNNTMTIWHSGGDDLAVTRGIAGLIDGVPVNVLAAKEIGKILTAAIPLLPQSTALTASIAVAKSSAVRFAAKYSAQFALAISLRAGFGTFLRAIASLPVLVVSLGTEFVRQCAEYGIEANKMGDAIDDIKRSIKSCAPLEAALNQATERRDGLNARIDSPELPDGQEKDDLMEEELETFAFIADIKESKKGCDAMKDQVTELAGSRAWIAGLLQSSWLCRSLGISAP